MTEQTEHTERRPGERILIWLLLAFSIFVLITALMIAQSGESLLIGRVSHLYRV